MITFQKKRRSTKSNTMPNKNESGGAAGMGQAGKNAAKAGGAGAQSGAQAGKNQASAGAGAGSAGKHASKN
ncbi:unnamed protein product [Gordionus sp. m RMFG-2023]